MPKIIVYGADWCHMTRAALELLRRRKIDFKYIDIDRNPQAAEWVARQNGGKEKKPTIDIDGVILSEPTDRELEEALQSAR